jgi:hypothetical protein
VSLLRHGVRNEVTGLHKAAAVEQWTADPCGSSSAEGEQDSKSYFENLVRGRFDYAPWIPEALGYEETRGLR